MLNEVDLAGAMADAIADARHALDVGTDGEAVDQVVILVSYLLPNGETIALSSPVVKRDPNLGRLALDLQGELGLL